MDLNIEVSWKEGLKSEWSKPYFIELMKFIENEYAVNPESTFPKKSEVFRAFEACSLENTKVVILGQDPYPTKGHANGLCFSVEGDVRPLPKSLKNIFKELTDDQGIPLPENGDLNRWAEQGVLLLNTVLTVSEGQADSHKKKGWEQFTDAVIELLSTKKQDVVYFLWGSKAQKKAESVDRENNLILAGPHPSPLSAYRGFFGCKHFSQANNYLKEKGIQEIEW